MKYNYLSFIVLFLIIILKEPIMQNINNLMYIRNNNLEIKKFSLKIKINSLNNSNWQVSNSWNNAVNDFILFGQKSIDFLFKIITFLI